ncbi:cytochrome P450 [Kutzneria albida]|nr:cytochrome P450 [Kutzneria albida]
MPHPRWRVPLVGDVLGRTPRTPLQDSMRLARELGPVYERKLFRRRFVIVSDAEMAAELAEERRFGKHVLPGVAKLRDLAGDGLFTAYNEEPNWRKAHDILRPAFTQQAMRGYHPHMLAVARELLARWDARDRVEVTPDMTRLTLETIGRTGFGYSFDSFQRERPHPFVSAMFATLRHAQRNLLRPPLVGDLLFRKADRRYDVDRAYMASVVDEVIRARVASGDQRTDDLLGLMLNTAHADGSGPLDEVNIRNQVITFLVAGHETTSGALSFALYYLARNPEVLARAQAEVDAEWGAGGEPDPSFEQVAKLRYVRRVFDEALRLWPTAPAFARQAKVDTVLGGRLPLRAGEWVLLLIPMLHRDPVWGQDVERFDPDRFLPERVKARPAHVFKPWGTGERACIGRQFALHEAILVLGLLLHRYDFAADPDYALRVQELLTLKPEGFSLTLSARRHTGAARGGKLGVNSSS